MKSAHHPDETMIKVVFCDIGGVLLTLDPERTVTLWARKAGVSPDHIRSRFPLDLHHQYERGMLTDKEFYSALVREMQIPALSFTDFRAGWRTLIGDETGFWTILRQTFPRCPVWLLSNTNPLHINGDLPNRFSFFKDVDGAIFSYEVRHRKPEPGIFHYACRVAGVAPAEALFIDDSEENIQAADQLGFHTIHYRILETSQSELERLVRLR
ncbi:MAG: HAD family hydrolase [Fidelibacterota bacterium]